MIERLPAAIAVLLFVTLSGVAAQTVQKGAPPLPPQPKVRPAGIPTSDVMVSPCIPGMGEHWANLKAGLHATALYGTYEGKPVFTEVMLVQKDFADGKSFTDVLKPLPGYKIDHVDIEFLPHGHPGMPIPHYDLHGYYVPHSVHTKFCPGSTTM